MVHRSMENNPRVADTLYLKRNHLVSADSLCFCLYSFCCVANKQITLNRFDFCGNLFSKIKMNFRQLLQQYIIVSNITVVTSCPLH